MKSTKLLAFFMALAMTLIPAAVSAQEGFVRFSIDKKIFSDMSTTQQNALITRTQELVQFIDRDVRKKIPADILAKIQDLKIKISLTDMPGRDGLFVPQDTSEQVIQVQLVQVYSNGIKALLAHEIYHAIHFSINPDELPWVREGMAQVFEFIATGELNGMNLYAAINDPMTPLYGEYSPEEKFPAQYGHNQLYFYYLYSHCGKESFFWKLTAGKNQLKGSFLIDEILGELNLSSTECRDFSESAISFEVAKVHNQMQFTNISQRNKYFLYPGDISPRFKKVQSAEEFKTLMDNMPALSSYRLPLEELAKYKMPTGNFAIFYASNGFPYEVSESAPLKGKGISAIIVKLGQ
nr:hypothetical protein BHI3_26440 [Bacteriovorax sp. HI3]